ncbi:pentapeptide repeat-containing protein [Stenotrophomonas rhizophila]
MTSALPKAALAMLYAAGASLPLPPRARFVDEQIDDLALQGVNLAAPIFEGCRVQRGTFAHCDFSGVRFFHRNQLAGCRFTRADFRNSGLNDTVFRECVFDRCDFRQSRFNECVLDRCTFINCRIVDTDMPAQATTGCRFEGTLKDVRFVAAGAPAQLDADFSRCILDDVSFENCRLDHVVPPRDPRHAYLPDVAVRARRALDALPATPHDTTTKVLMRRLRRYAQMQGTILNLDNLRCVEDPAVAAALIAALAVA